MNRVRLLYQETIYLCVRQKDARLRAPGREERGRAAASLLERFLLLQLLDALALSFAFGRQPSP